MKKFKEYLNEEIMPFAQTEKGFVGVDNGPVRDNINIHLSAATAKPFATPYHAMEVVRKVLAAYSIFPPSTNFLDGDSGHEVFQISQFGNKYGMTNDGNTIVKNFDPYYVYFEYAMNDKGGFDVFCEVIEEDELEEILSDVEDEVDADEVTTGDGKDAEDSFDDYKSDNQVNEAVFGGKKYPKKNPNKTTKTTSVLRDMMNRHYGSIADAKPKNRERHVRLANTIWKEIKTRLDSQKTS